MLKFNAKLEKILRHTLILSGITYFLFLQPQSALDRKTASHDFFFQNEECTQLYKDLVQIGIDENSIESNAANRLPPAESLDLNTIYKNALGCAQKIQPEERPNGDFSGYLINWDFEFGRYNPLRMELKGQQIVTQMEIGEIPGCSKFTYNIADDVYVLTEDCNNRPSVRSKSEDGKTQIGDLKIIALPNRLALAIFGDRFNEAEQKIFSIGMYYGAKDPRISKILKEREKNSNNGKKIKAHTPPHPKKNADPQFIKKIHRSCAENPGENLQNQKL